MLCFLIQNIIMYPTLVKKTDKDDHANKDITVEDTIQQLYFTWIYFILHGNENV